MCESSFLGNLCGCQGAAGIALKSSPAAQTEQEGAELEVSRETSCLALNIQTLVYCHVESVKLWIDLTPHGCSGKCSQLTNPSLGLFTALLSLVTSIWDNFFIFMTCKEYPEKPNLLPNKQSHFWFIFELSVWFPEIWLCLGWTSRLKLCLTPTDSWTLP